MSGHHRDAFHGTPQAFRFARHFAQRAFCASTILRRAAADIVLRGLEAAARPRIPRKAEIAASTC
jgi:hypothetical protein